MDCKFIDKNLGKMLTDGQIDLDVGVSVATTIAEIKEEEVDDDLKALKHKVAELKLTYLIHTRHLRN